MKTLLLAIFIGSSTCLVTSANPNQPSDAQRIQQLYRVGLAASQQGDIAKAKAAFNAILEIQPGHGHAIYQLGNLEQNRAAAVKTQRERRFATTTIPKIDFNEAPLEETLVYLSQQAFEVTEGEFSPNFIIQDPDGVLAAKEVTMKLNNVPLKAVLKYLEDMTGAVVRYDEFATVIMPRAKATPQ